MSEDHEPEQADDVADELLKAAGPELEQGADRIGRIVRSIVLRDPSIVGWSSRTTEAGLEVTLRTRLVAPPAEPGADTGGPNEVPTRTITFTVVSEQELEAKLDELVGGTKGERVFDPDDEQPMPPASTAGQGPELPPPPDPTEPTDDLTPAQYGQARQAILTLAAALGTIPGAVVESLALTADKSLETTIEGLMLQGFTREDAVASRRQLEVEARIFRSAVNWRKAIELAAEEARASAGTIITDLGGNGTRKPPPPPRKQGKAKRKR